MCWLLGSWTTGLLTADGLRHVLLPAITLSVFQLTLIMRLVRAEMLEVAAHRLHQVRPCARPQQ